MGFSKWLLKKGFGSPGQTAKGWTKEFLKTPAHMGREQVFEQIITSFQYG